MNVETVRLLFDFGLLVLIWLVQLVIYPSFRYYTDEQLISWHRKYTLGIAMMVIPLLFGQLLSTLFQCFQNPTTYTLGSITLIALVWAVTFTIFVPLHQKISNGKSNSVVLQRLVAYNWWRTFLWTLLFAWSLYTLL